MVGVNQVIMLSLNMVIIASMIGAGGLGFDVLTALRRLDIGAGLEAGLAIVVLAIALDRLSQAMAARGAGRVARRPAARHLRSPAALLLVVGDLAGSGSLARRCVRYPEAWTLSTGTLVGRARGVDQRQLLRHARGLQERGLLNLLVPVKRFLLAQPWPWVDPAARARRLRLGGRAARAAVPSPCRCSSWSPASGRTRCSRSI